MKKSTKAIVLTVWLTLLFTGLAFLSITFMKHSFTYEQVLDFAFYFVMQFALGILLAYVLTKRL